MAHAISINVPFTCPQCGQQLLGRTGKAEAKADEMVHCPVHGDVATLGEIQKQATESLGRQASHAFEKALKNAGVTFTKEKR